MNRVLLLAAFIPTLTNGYDYLTVSTGCGTSRGCMILPNGCQNVNRGTNCTTSVIWERTSTGVRFEFSADISKMNMGTATHWSALGISTNEYMDLDTVLECVLGPNGTGVFRVSWNDKTKNEVLLSTPTGFITDPVVSRDDGRLVCGATWNHAARWLGDPTFQFKVYDLSNSSQYHLLLARGYADPVTRAKFFHDITDSEFFPWTAGTAASFCPSCSYANLSSTAHQALPPRKIKHSFAISHGVLMMSAWWIFGSTAILSARYLKTAESTCCTAPVWWALHRPLMLLSFICATVAFFFIYYISGWRVRTCNVACTTDDYLGQLHALIGTVTYAFMCFQVLLGIIRPSLDSPIRPCFNWLHWMFGSTAWICASTACAMAIPLGKTGLQSFYQNWPRHVMMAVVLTFIATVIICEYFHRFRKPEEKSEAPGLSPIVPLVIVCNLLVAIAGVAVIAWMLVEAYLGYGFTL